MASGDVITGTGDVYWAIAGTNTLAGGIAADTDIDVTEDNLSMAPGAGWSPVGNLAKEGFVFAPGQQTQLIEVANSNYAIGAREVRRSAAFSLTLLDATLENIRTFGMGEVGVSDIETSSDRKQLDFERHGGPEQEVLGIAILFDGFGAAGPSGDPGSVRRRYWIPRAVNTAPLALAANDNGPQVIVCQFSIVLADFTAPQTSATELPAARLIDGPRN